MMRYYIINMLQRTSTARYTGSIQRARKQQKKPRTNQGRKTKKTAPSLTNRNTRAISNFPKSN